MSRPERPERFEWDPTLPCRIATLDLGAVAYTAIGAGPPVVFVHGYGDSLFTWRHQLTALRDHFHLYALDLLGYGASDHPPIEYTADVFIACVRQFMDAMGLASATLVGSSLGGATALALAHAHPARVDRLIVLGPTIPGVQPHGRAFDTTFWLARRGALGAALVRPAWKAAIRAALREAVVDQALITDTLVDVYAQFARGPGFKEAYLSTARHWPGWMTRRPRCGELKMPVLIIWGEEDRVHPIRQAALLRTLIPQAELVRVPRCGHLPHVEHPDRVNRLAQQFISGRA